MAVRYDVSIDRLVIAQTRRGLRICMWIFALGFLAGLVVILVPRHVENVVVCTPATGCTVVYQGHDPKRIAFDEIDRTQTDGGQLWLVRKDGTRQHLCSGTDDELAPFARDFTVAVKARDTFQQRCTSTLGEIPRIGKLAGIGGALFILLMLGAYLTESEVVVDLAAKTIKMRGFKWPRKRWALDRPIADVVSVVVQQVYVGRGQRRPVVSVKFKDKRVVLAWAPMAFRKDVLDERVAELRKFLSHS